MKNVVLLAKRRQLKLLISVIRNQIRESLCSQKKILLILLILKIVLTRRKILLTNMLFLRHRDDVDKCPEKTL